MRLPLKEEDEISQKINQTVKCIEEKYISLINPLLSMNITPVMLSDGTVIKSETFIPDRVIELFKTIANSVSSWMPSSDISQNRTEDVGRINCKYYHDIVTYIIIIDLGIQFHALPYYKPDKRVIEIKKEMIRLEEESSSINQSLSQKGDKLIEKEIQKSGMQIENFEDAFKSFFEREDFLKELELKIDRLKQDIPNYAALEANKEELLKQLNSFIIEHYRISSKLLNQMNVIQKEEGVILNIDIEKKKGDKTNIKKIKYENKMAILESLQKFSKVIDIISNQQKSKE